jgi:hypothetical protein
MPPVRAAVGTTFDRFGIDLFVAGVEAMAPPGSP